PNAAARPCGSLGTLTSTRAPRPSLPGFAPRRVLPTSNSPRQSPPASPARPEGGRKPMSPLAGIVIAATGIGGKPDPNGLPGSPALEQLVNGLAFWGLLAALAGLVISAAVWALSAHSGNYHHASVGRRGTLVSAAAAFLVGAAPAIVAFFENLGNTVH